MSPQRLFHANLETSHFTFNAYARTADEARRVMRDTFTAHLRQSGVSAREARARWSEFADGVNVMHVAIGSGYRDHQDDAPLVSA